MELGSLPVAGQTPQMVNVTFHSAPEEGPGNYFIFIDNVFVATPITYSWNVGDTHLLTVAIETRADVDCSVHSCDYWFTSWSDNGLRNHTITVTPSTTSYTAFFVKRAYIFISASPPALGDVRVDNVPIANYPQFFGWMPGSTHQLTALNTNGQFVYWSAPSFTQIAMNTVEYTTPSEGENITANYIPQTTTTTTVTTSSQTNTEQTTVTSNPTSVGIISVDGDSITTPQTFSWAIGTTHILFAPETAPCLNVNFTCSYTFQNWFAQSSRFVSSNSFIYTVPSWSETVVAFYQQTPYPTTTTASSTTASTTSQNPDFSLSASPSSISLPPNNFVGSVGFTMTLTSVGGWAGQVQFAASALPGGITVSDLPQSYQLGAGGTASWDVFVGIGTSTPAGSYQLVISGISGSLIHSAIVTINASSPSTAVSEFPSSASLALLAVCIVFVSVVVRRRQRCKITSTFFRLRL